MSKETVTLVVDGREPSKVFDEVEAHDEVDDWKIGTLESGDIKVGPIGFERKTVGDYAEAMMSEGQRQLEKQVAKMTQEYEHAFILLDGDLVDTQRMTHSSVLPHALRGSMAKNTAVGVPVIPCSDTKLLVDMAVRISRKHLEDTELRYMSKGPVDVDQPPTVRMFGCLPGVGAGTAEQLHNQWPTMDELTEATEAELMALDGIGEKTAERIIATLNEGN